MGRKRLHNQKSPSKLKKIKSSLTTIESMFRRTDQSNESNPSTSTDESSIIEIIDEWVNTEEEIKDEDVAYITSYFIDLADEKDKPKIKSIVDHFYESVSKREAEAQDWRNLYNETIGLISSEFEELNFEFF